MCTLGEKRYSRQERGNLGPGRLCPGSEGHQASHSLLCLEPKVILRARADALLHGGDPGTKYLLTQFLVIYHHDFFPVFQGF